MTLNQTSLVEHLAPRPFRFYQQADSTNDLALAWLSQGAPSGAAVIADEQLKGRGRLGRSWYTPPSTALIVSVILHPAPQHLAQITMLGAVSICEMIESLGASNVGIKWPNDVQLNGLKVSGVLPEAVWEGGKLRGVVLGMGVNVRQDFSHTELATTAISLEPALGKTLDRSELLAFLLARMDNGVEHLGTSSLFNAWKSRLNTLGQSVSLLNNGQSISGIAEGVDENGALLVRDRTGQLQRVLAGDIAMGS